MRGVTCAAHARARRASAPPPASAAPLRSLRDGAAAAAGKPPPPPGGRRAACAAAGKARCDAPGRHGARAAAQRHSGAFRCGWDAHTASPERARLPQQAAVHSLTALGPHLPSPLLLACHLPSPFARASLSRARRNRRRRLAGGRARAERRTHPHGAGHQRERGHSAHGRCAEGQAEQRLDLRLLSAALTTTTRRRRPGVPSPTSLLSHFGVRPSLAAVHGALGGASCTVHQFAPPLRIALAEHAAGGWRKGVAAVDLGGLKPAKVRVVVTRSGRRGASSPALERDLVSDSTARLSPRRWRTSSRRRCSWWAACRGR